MFLFFQLTLICPAVTPEHICIHRNSCCDSPITAICLEVPIVRVHPGAQGQLRYVVSLDEEKFGLARQQRASVSIEKTPDLVDRKSIASQICAQKLTFCATANDAADKAIISEFLHLIENIFES